MLDVAHHAGEAHLYQALARELADAIGSGTLKTGDRLPSTRKISARYGVSMATAVQAFRELENRRLIEARPRSGFFVARALPRAPEPAASRPPTSARLAVRPTLLQEYVESLSNATAIRLGAVLPPPDWFPAARLARLASAVNRRRPELSVTYTVSRGAPELRQVIARRALEMGCHLQADDIVVTDGCVEALNLCLRTVARPGDTVALESPTYFILLHILESLGLKVLEIPTHPKTGASLEALDLATAKPGAVKAMLLMPTYSNPLGSVMPDDNKARLVAMCDERGIALIEDDVYGDTFFGATRPFPAKAWDKRGSVLYCSSFTKTLAPGLRVGWVAPGRYLDEVALAKRATTVFTPQAPQLAIAELIATGGYDHHLRRLRAALVDHARRVAQRVQQTFPAGCRITQPTGGYVLWIELPRKVDAIELFRKARARGVVVAPGPLFTNSNRFPNYIRLSYSQPWSPAIEDAIGTVGQIASAMS
ncbi:MAG: PLP-dependent aminotransferase family protein [Casimicrobiaceae bacterium]